MVSLFGGDGGRPSGEVGGLEGPFARRPGGAGIDGDGEVMAREVLRKQVFAKVKPICVSILSFSSLHPSILPALLSHLSALRRTLDSLPARTRKVVLTPSLIHYIFFPISALLQRNAPARGRQADASESASASASAPPLGLGPGLGLPDRVLEGVFGVLGVLAEEWWTSLAGLVGDGEGQPEVWEELWMLALIAIRGAPGAVGDGEGTSEETKAAAVEFMFQLLRTRSERAQGADEGEKERGMEWEWDGVSPLPSLDDLLGPGSESESKDKEKDKEKPIYPPPQLVRRAISSLASRATLGHTVVALLDVVRDQRLLRLRTAALDLLRLLFETYLQPAPSLSFSSSSHPQPLTHAQLLAVFLPGTISALCRVLLNRSRPPPASASSSSSYSTSLGLPPSSSGAGWANAQLVTKGLDVFVSLVRDAVGDQVVFDIIEQERDHGAPDVGGKIEKLEDLARVADEVERRECQAMQTTEALDSRPPPPSPRPPSPSPSPSPAQPQISSFAPPLTYSWLRSTLPRVSLALRSIAPLRSHPSPLARRALAEAARDVLLASASGWSAFVDEAGPQELEQDAAQHVNRGLQTLLEWLLLLSADASSLEVQHTARSALRSIFFVPRSLVADETRTRTARRLAPLLERILKDAMESVAASTFRHDDEKVIEAAKRMESLVDLFISPALPSGDLVFVGAPRGLDALGPQGGVEKWGWSLLACLELQGEPAVVVPGAHGGADADRRAWSTLGVGYHPLLQGPDQGEPESHPSTVEASFPPLRLLHLRSSDAQRQLSRTLTLLGTAAWAAAGGQPVSFSSAFAPAQRSRPAVKPERTFFLVQHFLDVARRMRGPGHVERGASALFVVERLLQGLADGIGEGYAGDDDARVVKARRTALHRLAREVVDQVLRLDEDDEDFVDGQQAFSSKRPGEDEEEEASVTAVEHVRGPSALTTLLDRQNTAVASAAGASQREAAERRFTSQRVVSSALSLRLLAVCAHILGSGFRPLLIHALYPVLSQLSSPSFFLRTTAERALSSISASCAYAAPRNLVLDNVDYVINAVSQRLMVNARLEKEAPLVLIECVRLVGKEVVPMVHDIVDDIFDALDDYHGYHELCSTLLAVLDAVVATMADHADGGEARVRRESKLLARVTRDIPKPSEDLDSLEAWVEEWATREDAEKIERDDLPHLEGPLEGVDEAIAEADPTSTVKDDVDNDRPAPPPTRAQQVCVEILEKALPFLSHPSAFLRARVLALFAHAVPVLALSGREGDLLPLVHRTWPYIMNRLASSAAPDAGGPRRPAAAAAAAAAAATTATPRKEEPFVVAEACALLESLAQHVGDFVSKRIIDDAWPRLRRLLDAQMEKDRKSAFPFHVAQGARRIGGGGGTRHTISHRLHRSILSTLGAVVSRVPIQDALTWELCLRLRVFLDVRQDDEIQLSARRVYLELAEVNADAVWLVLRSTMQPPAYLGDGGREDHARDEGDFDLPAFLYEPDLDVAYNAGRILDVLV